MIKRIAAAAGVAALLGTSAAALAGSSITLSSTPVELKPVAVDGQWSVSDGESGRGATGHTEAHTEAPTATTTSSSVDISTSTQTTQAVEQHEPAEQAAAEDAYRAQASDQASDAEPMMEDDPRWDCHTMGNRICGPGHE